MNNETLNTGKNGRRITIKNIADELNLSSSAVSAILNKKKNCFASKKTKENVFRTASELNYRPNRFARSLRTRKSDSIGIIVTSFEVNVLLNAIQFVESLAWKRNYRLFIANSNGDPDREELLLDEFYSTPVDGIILIPTGLSSTNSFLRQLTAEEFPVVTVNPVENVSVDFVATNYRKGGFIAVEHLVNLGYKEIGFFGNSLKYYSMAERFAGYREALERYNLKFKDEFVFHAETRNFPDVYEFAKKIISAKHIPHAIFASNDIFAIAFIKAAIEKGFKVPRDFSVVGFDDDKIANFSPVPLTTVRQSGEQLGRNVFNLLMKKIEDSSIKGERIILNPRLIVRQSTKKAGKFKD